MNDILIICRDRYHAERIGNWRLGFCVASADDIRAGGITPIQHVIVCEGVDLDSDRHGEGTLRNTLKKRQSIFGNSATFIQL